MDILLNDNGISVLATYLYLFEQIFLPTFPSYYSPHLYLDNLLNRQNLTKPRSFISNRTITTCPVQGLNGTYY